MNAEEKQKEIILAFADKYLQPYRLHEKFGGQEVIPKLCPFCHGGEKEDENTFALSVDKGVYVCKRGSCGKRGRFEELAKHCGEKGDFAFHFPSNNRESERQYAVPDTLLTPPTDQIYAYFETRKISKKTVDDFHIQSDADGNIVFPFYENGVDVYEKFRRPWKPSEKEKKRKEWCVSGAKPVLFGMDDCTFSKPLIITEGQIDAMSLYEAGITNVVSVPSGCDDVRWIENCYEWLSHFRQIILFGDSDEPGRKMVQTVSKRLDESRCLIVEDYPLRDDGTPMKDANEILFRCGEFTLIEMVENAKAVPIKGIIDLSTVTPYDPTAVPRIKTMVPDLDSALGGLLEGSITIFTGKAGMGKSTLTGLLLLNAIEQGYNVCAYSGELRKEKFQEWINLQCAGSDYIGIKYDPIRGQNIAVVPYVVQQRLMDYYRGRFYLFDNNEIFEHNQAESIIDVFTMAVRRYNCKLFLVDNMMTSLSDAEEETKAQGKFVNALKKFATKYAVHILIVAHARKTKAGETLKKDDVGGNSAIVNLADSAIVVERPNLRIIKNREGGIEKLIECCYCPDSRRIYQNGKGDLNKFSWNKDGIVSPTQLACSLPEFAIQLGDTQPF